MVPTVIILVPLSSLPFVFTNPGGVRNNTTNMCLTFSHNYIFCYFQSINLLRKSVSKTTATHPSVIWYHTCSIFLILLHTICGSTQKVLFYTDCKILYNDIILHTLFSCLLKSTYVYLHVFVFYEVCSFLLHDQHIALNLFPHCLLLVGYLLTVLDCIRGKSIRSQSMCVW